MIKLNNVSTGISTFEWSTSEQVWPFEKTYDGKTIYCKYFQVEYSGTYGAWAHGISSPNGSKVRRLYGMMRGNANMGEGRPLPFIEVPTYEGYNVDLKSDATNIMLISLASYPSVTCDIFMMYEK